MFCHLICMLLPLRWGLALCHLHQRCPLNKCQGAGCTPALQNFIPLVLGDAEAAFGHLLAPGGCMSPLKHCWPCRRMPAGGSCLPQGDPQALTLASAQLMLWTDLSPGSRLGAIHPVAWWPLTRQAFAAAAGAGCLQCPTICHQLLWLPSPCGSLSLAPAVGWGGSHLCPWGGPLGSACWGGADLPILGEKFGDSIFLGAGLAKWGNQECLFEVLQHSEGTISNPGTGFCSHTAHGAAISLSPVPRSSSPHCCGFPVPKVAVLGLFSHEGFLTAPMGDPSSPAAHMAGCLCHWVPSSSRDPFPECEASLLSPAPPLPGSSRGAGPHAEELCAGASAQA